MKDITTNLFRVKSSSQPPAVGGLLVAEPFIHESYFNHGVVSLIDYVPDEGATGVVMNNRTEYQLNELLEGIETRIQIPVFCGGPLGQDRLYFLHTLGSEIIPNARRYAPGIYIGGDFDAIISYVNAGYPVDGAVRVFYRLQQLGRRAARTRNTPGKLGHSPATRMCIRPASYRRRQLLAPHSSVAWSGLPRMDPPPRNVSAN